MSVENGERPSLNKKLNALERRLPVISVNKEPVGCGNCVGACCRAGTVLKLSDAEAAQLRLAGTSLTLYETQAKKRLFSLFTKKTDRRNHVMKTDCGNLQEDNSCGDYANRPENCRTLQAGDPGCIVFRDRQGLPDTVDDSSIRNFRF